MRPADLRPLRLWIEAQPSWSDLPFILLTHRGGPEGNHHAARLSDILGNVSFLERPFHPVTFASLARTAFKARQRQYEAKARMEELRESEGRLATALLAGRLGAWEYDIASRTLVASPLCRAILGLGPEEPFGCDDFWTAIHREDSDRVERAVRSSIETGGDYSIEHRVIARDGTTHWVQADARTIVDREGRRVSIVGVAADTTERKEAEVKLKELNETLERRVTERTAELERTHAKVIEEIRQREVVESQLRQVQKLEMIGQLTGGVAHDFNNLLMAILGNLGLLRKHVGSDPKALRLIDGAEQGANRGASLTQRLLAFARRQSLDLAPTDIAALVRNMKELLERSIGPNVSLRFEVADEPSFAMVDANQVELALLNLVVNARDAMPEGGEIFTRVDRVRVGVGEDLAPGDYVRLTVTDTGAGMDEETLKRAIEPFFSTKELGKGTGLGLSMIHGLAVQLQGALRLESRPGAGTRAELYLPATERVEEAAAPEVRAEHGAMRRLKVLLVDDDALVSMSTVAMLEDLGHEVLEARSGKHALELIEKAGRVDLLITDFAMPGMTGAQLAEAARRMNPDLPVLLATGYAELPDGANVKLPKIGKPYTQAQLAQEIAKLAPR
jgi:PAS domain S-box-containing protein